MGAFGGWRTDSSCRQQLWYPQEIVGGHGEGEEPADASGAEMAGLAQLSNGLDPAEGFLDPLADDLGDGVAGMACGSPIDGRLARLAALPDMAVDGDMGCDAALAQAVDELFDVIGLVGAQRDPSPAGPV